MGFPPRFVSVPHPASDAPSPVRKRTKNIANHRCHRAVCEMRGDGAGAIRAGTINEIRYRRMKVPYVASIHKIFTNDLRD